MYQVPGSGKPSSSGTQGILLRPDLSFQRPGLPPLLHGDRKLLTVLGLNLFDGLRAPPRAPPWCPLQTLSGGTFSSTLAEWPAGLCILLPIRMPTARCRGPLTTPSTVTTMPAEVADARKTMSLRPPPKPEAPPREGVPLPARPPPRPRVSPPRRTHPSSRFHRTTTASPGANPRAALCGGGGRGAAAANQRRIRSGGGGGHSGCTNRSVAKVSSNHRCGPGTVT